MMESHKFDFKANYVYATFDDVDGVICKDGLSKEIQDKLETYQKKSYKELWERRIIFYSLFFFG